MRFANVVLLTAGFVLGPAAWLLAAVPSENLLPASTKGFLSIPSVKALDQNWSNTQLGKLMADPALKPFVESIRDEIRTGGQQRLARLGLTWDDLRKVPTGEIAVAICWDAPVEATRTPGRAGLVAVADVTGNKAGTEALIAKLTAGLTKEGGKRAKSSRADVIYYTLPAKAGETRAREAAIYFGNDLLAVGDHLNLIEQIAAATASGRKESLAEVASYAAITNRLVSAVGDTAPHVRWFVEPFGYAEAVRALEPARQKRRGKDVRRALANQGFDAIQGVGGYVNFMVNELEILHRTVVFAPPVVGAAPSKYLKAGRMLNFPTTPRREPQSWVPAEVASYVDFSWNMQEAFEGFGSIFDEMADDPGVFEAVLESLETDRNGPKVDLRGELVANLGTRVSILTQNMVPINDTSERMLFALEVTNIEAVAEALRKSMEADPEVVRRTIGDHVVWEIVTSEGSGPGVEINHVEGGPGAVVRGTDDDGSDRRARRRRGRDVEEEESEEEPRVFPNGAFTVLPSSEPGAAQGSGYLLVASNLDYMTLILTGPTAEKKLRDAADFIAVAKQTDAVADEMASMRSFVRTADTNRITYETLRAGKMVTSQSALSRGLNELMGNRDGEPRKQRIDGSTLPEFDTIRDSFGPAGAVVETEENGWFITGFTLPSSENGQ